MAETGNTIKNKIVVEGEKEYKASLDQMRRSLAETKSELRATKTEFASQEESAQSLQAQIDVLTRQYAANESQCRTLEEYLNKTAQTFGENSKEASDLRVRLNNARAAMNTTGNELGTLQKRLDAVSDASGDAGGGFDAVGESAQRAAQDVGGLVGEIGNVVGKTLIEFEVGKTALKSLAEGVKWALGEAIAGQNEDAQTRALAGDDALAERRTAIKDSVDRQWAGLRDGNQTVSDVAIVDTALGNEGVTDESRVTKLTNWAITIDEVFGQGVQATIDRATAMVNTFGVSWEEALDLMVKGQRDMSDGGAQMLAAYEDYGQAYKQLGYDIDDMYSAIASAANDNALGKDSNLNKGVENFINSITSGSKESTEALKALNILASDLPDKFQKGGATAAAAVQSVLTSLKGIEDEAKRNEIGKALFGDKVWTDSAGRIVDVLLAGYNQTVDAAGATADAMAAKLDTLGSAAAQTGERISQEAGKFFTPMLDSAKEALQVLIKNTDETGSVVSGLVKSVIDANKQTATGAAQAFEGAKESYQGWARELATDISSGRWIDKLKEKNAEAAQVAEQTNQTVEEQRAALDEKLKAINQAITDADIAGNYAEAAKLMQERDQIIADIAEMSSEVKESYTSMGVDAANAVEAQGPRMQSAADGMGKQAVDALLDKQPDMMDAGDLMGSAGYLGALAGLGDGYAIGESFGGAVASGIRSQTENVKRAAEALSRAGSGAARTTFQIHSPSRVGLDIGENYGGAIAEGIRRRQEDVAAAGALLARAADGGTRETLPNGMDAAAYARSAQGDGLSEEALERAFVRALSGVAFCIDGVEAGYLLERGVSRAGYDRAAATVSGRSAARRI